MIEIVFSDSAGGLLKHAQHYGNGPYNDQSHPALIFYGVKGRDEKEVQQEEIDAYLKKYHEKERYAWESAIPLRGRSSDVYDFDLGLSMGDITIDVFSEKRLIHLNDAVPFHTGHVDAETYFKKKYQRYRDMAERALRQIADGEPVRIWYSNTANEYCGLLWFCWMMRNAGVSLNQVHAVKLPDWYYDEAANSVLTHSAWGEVHPSLIGHMAKSTQLLPEAFICRCAAAWDDLQQENASLRAVVSGHLISVPEDFYDHLLLKSAEKLHAEKGTFTVGQLVGGVLNHQLGIWDSWLACRVDKFVEAGLLEVTEFADDGWFYRNKLILCK